MLERTEGQSIVSVAKIDERQGYSILLDSGDLLLILGENIELRIMPDAAPPQK
jgi:hypothetical protein